MRYVFVPETKQQQLAIIQFIKDHHYCDPARGVQIVNIKLISKFETYTDIIEEAIDPP